MTLGTALTRISYALRGLDDDAPTIGSDEANQWTEILNRKKDELYEDVTKEWSYSYRRTAPNETGTVATTATTTLTGTGTFFTDYSVGDKLTVVGETVRTIATITSDTVLTVTSAFSNTASGKTFTRQIIIDDGVDEYSLNRAFISPSDKLYVLTTDNNKIFLNYKKPQENDYTNRQVDITGVNPRVLSFTDDIESTEDIVGGELFVPGYYMPADISDEDDLLPVPDPNWLVAAVAAEVSSTDIVYEDRQENLTAKANYLYKLMNAKNRRGVYGNAKQIPNNVRRITSPGRY